MFIGLSEMHARTREHDWASTPVGPVETWPQSLKALVRTLLSSSYPMVLTWGPSFTQFYNDAYSKLIGDGHPAALGLDIRITLAASWDTLGPMIHQVMTTGVANWTPALMLLMERSGYREEAYFSVSHAPAEDDEGRIVGMLAVCSEVTQQVLAERRTRLLRDLASRASETRSVEKTCRDVAAAISGHPLDVPFAHIYLRGPDGRTFTRQGAIGLGEDDPSSPASVDVEKEGDRIWSLKSAAAGETILLEDVERRVTLTGGPWKDPVRSALVMPIASSGQTAPLGVLVVGLSPNRALDEGYRSFCELLASQVSVALRNARAYEEERQRAEALAELDRAKTTFFSNISHEFRTPLTLMLGPVEHLLAGSAGALPEAARSELEVLHRNAGRLLRLVNTLLDFSRLEAGRIEASYAPQELSALTADLASSFRSTVERAGLKLTVDCPPLSRPVYLDRDSWEKIVLNLVSNAFKFTFEGEISVRTRERNGRAVLEVKDTGTGIAAAELPRIFERFHRVRDTRSRTHEGTGIGLALVRELVELHGGTVRVDSTEGQGTTFTVELPFDAAHLPPERIRAPRTLEATTTGPAPYIQEASRWSGEEAPGPHAPRPDTSAKTGSTPRGRVLLADDNADMRDYIRRVLSSEFEVEAVADGQAALESALAHPPDLVLSDVMMPRLDGVGLLRALRAAPHTKDLPILLLSARAGEEATLEGLASGADDYLVKPFSARELLARVRTRFELVRMRQEVARERAQVESLMEAVRARDDFLSVASHELKTPLTSFQLNLNAIERGLRHVSHPSVGERLDVARRSVRRLARLIETLLDVSQLTTGRLQLEPERVDLATLVGEVVAASEEEAQRQGTPLNVHLESPLTGCFDRDRMEQVVHHLLSNALKFGQGRPVEVSLRSDGSGAAVLSVVDHGIGIPPADRARIFERFERAVSVKNFGGLGLGLWVTRQVVEAHQGAIRVEDTPGGGATFHIQLPRHCRGGGAGTAPN
ncbi:hybrid sensor histidine kinase/response regulator [Archangium lipolyticum]|uniref:hybrid sensor histidine kinase/response regulator n=1 Tax=Archangium lipolyticum TaxID=2970465 RepID=UPI00214A8667|nr:ATP-binding protein [Archangium lipolyticum]